MSYFGSLYASPPQTVFIGAGGTVAINPVNIDYTRLTLAGYRDLDTSGGVSASPIVVYFSTPSLLAAFGASGQAYVVVEEFRSPMFRQAFQHGYLTIPSGTNVGYVSHGLSLGPNAFVVTRGHAGTRTADTGGLALTEGQVRPTIHLGGPSYLEGFCYQNDYATGPGTITVGYTIIDPK